MNLKINHITKYTYETDVILNPHKIHLTLQPRSYYKILNQHTLIAPSPVGKINQIDLENNAYTQVWFSGYTNELTIENISTIRTEKFNPFNFIYDNSFQKKAEAFHYGYYDNPLIQCYLHIEINKDIYTFTKDIYHSVNDVVSFLSKINETIYRDWNHKVRLQAGIHSPNVTFGAKEGSCRDLAYMCIHMMRSVGLAARFVSGYAYNPETSNEHNLHAWVEVYLPGCGWIGIDPSLGLFTDHNFFPVAASFDPLLTAPVIGTYGGEAGSVLFTDLMIEEFL